MKQTFLKKTFALFLLLGGMMVGFSACEEQGPEYVEDYDVVLTSYDENFDFGAVKYYSMPDSVAHIGEENIVDKISHDHDDAMLDQVEKEMEELGYVRLESDNETAPDVVVTLSAISTTYVGGGYYSPGYWWDNWYWWGGWYPSYPGYGNGWYPWYGYSPVYYAWDEGTVIIEMLDVKNLNEEEKKIPVVWNGVVNGLLVGDDDYIESRLVKNIGQAFTQSTYLGSDIE